MDDKERHQRSLISIRQAAANGIDRLKSPKWATPEDHIKIDIIDAEPGPWVHLWCPFNMECNGRDPVDGLAFQYGLDIPEWLAYYGPLPESDEYKTAVARYSGCLGEKAALA